MDIKKNKKIILYDQDCGFCNTCRDFSLKKNKNLIFFGIQSEEGNKTFLKNNITKRTDTIFVLEEKRYFIKSEGVARIFLTFKWPWKFLYYLWKITPTFFADLLYDTVSKNRGRFTRKKTCPVK